VWRQKPYQHNDTSSKLRKIFGPFGPKYEVGQALLHLDGDDWMVEVIMVETGEKAKYRLTHTTEDPKAH